MGRDRLDFGSRARHRPLLVDRPQLLLRCVRLVRGAVHQTKYLIEIGVSPSAAAWALGAVSLVAVPGQIALGHLSDRIGREWRLTITTHVTTYVNALSIVYLSAIRIGCGKLLGRKSRVSSGNGMPRPATRGIDRGQARPVLSAPVHNPDG